ncbi:MAG: hypothetical protein CFE44_19685 [Burkholderiales bacterium PBB4]|nr:MAG: hypothetical protein CFE44_19685 [Burkholderiales bacterium PBB4]
MRTPPTTASRCQPEGFADRMIPDYDDSAHLARRISQYSRVVCVGLSLAALNYLWLAYYPVAGLLALAAVAALGADRLCQRRHLSWSVAVLLGVCFAGLLGLMWMGGGLLDSVLPAVPILLLIGAQLLRPRYFAGFVVLVLAGVAGVGLATIWGWRITIFRDTDSSRLVDTLMLVAAAGALIWFLTRDVYATLRKLHEEIRRHQDSEHNLTYLAQHDALTRLPNRRLGAQRMADIMAEAGKYPHPVALLFVDLDNFKTINDSLGHAAGDEFLQMVAKRLRSGLRAEDLLCRQGGDEFLIGLPRPMCCKAQRYCPPVPLALQCFPRMAITLRPFCVVPT